MSSTVNLANVQQVAVVTGAAGGIGCSIAERLLNQGYAVALLDQVAPPSDHPQAVALACDVGDPRAVEQAFTSVEDSLGPVTHLVSAAGVLRPGTTAECSDDDWAEHLRVNASGTFHVLRAAGTRMSSRRQGAIVVVGSNAARVPRSGMAAYSASKAAAAMLARCTGLELAEYGVRCNVVEPGSTNTAMQRDLWPDPQLGLAKALQGDLDSHRVGIPLGRIAEPSDVADLVAFLLSDQARHITMQRILIDGGASL